MEGWDGFSVCLGVDSWIGCNCGLTFHEHMIIQGRGFSNLKLIVDHGITTLIIQGWLWAEAVGLSRSGKIAWNNYIDILKIINVRVYWIIKSLVWNFSSEDDYTPKYGYKFFYSGSRESWTKVVVESDVAL